MPWEADSLSSSQEILCLFWNLKSVTEICPERESSFNSNSYLCLDVPAQYFDFICAFVSHAIHFLQIPSKMLYVCLLSPMQVIYRVHGS